MALIAIGRLLSLEIEDMITRFMWLSNEERAN